MHAKLSLCFTVHVHCFSVYCTIVHWENIGTIILLCFTIHEVKTDKIIGI